MFFALFFTLHIDSAISPHFLSPGSILFSTLYTVVLKLSHALYVRCFNICHIFLSSAAVTQSAYQDRHGKICSNHRKTTLTVALKTSRASCTFNLLIGQRFGDNVWMFFTWLWKHIEWYCVFSISTCHIWGKLEAALLWKINSVVLNQPLTVSQQPDLRKRRPANMRSCWWPAIWKTLQSTHHLWGIQRFPLLLTSLENIIFVKLSGSGHVSCKTPLPAKNTFWTSVACHQGKRGQVLDL